MKYRIGMIGREENAYFEESDVIDAKPARDGVELILKAREQYQHSDGFKYAGRDKVSLFLNERQAQELLAQDRQEQTGFCYGARNRGCYDHGKNADPGDCARCMVLHAAWKSGMGDLRKSRPPRDHSPGWGLPLACALLLVAFWYCLFQWGEASRKLEATEHELQAVRLQLKKR